MNNFRSTHDEFVDIENRWRLLSSREAILAKRERDVRAKEEEIRELMSVNQSRSMVSMAMPMRTPMQMPTPRAPHQPQQKHHKQHRNHNIKAFRKKQHNDKDYSQFAVQPEKNTEIITNIDTDIHEFQSS